MSKRFTLLACLLILSANFVLAQDFPPGDFGDGDVNDTAPINQGIVMALAAGVAYGIKTLGKRKKS